MSLASLLSRSNEDVARDAVLGLFREVLDLTTSSNDGNPAAWQMAEDKAREIATICARTADRMAPAPVATPTNPHLMAMSAVMDLAFGLVQPKRPA